MQRFNTVKNARIAAGTVAGRSLTPWAMVSWTLVSWAMVLGGLGFSSGCVGTWTQGPSFPILGEGDRQGQPRLGSKLRARLASYRTTSKTPDTQAKLFRPDLAVLPFVEFAGDQITIRYVRDCRYRTEEDYDVRFYDLTFRLSEIRTVDFIVVPFKETPLLAHTMLSFGLSDGRYFVISVEARLGVDESYTAVAGAGRRYPLIYIVGDEKDMILLRTSIRDVEVFLYPGLATPDQVQNLLVDMLARVNKLQREPEYYDTITNNCTTNLVQHVNQLRPGRIPHDWRVLFPGHSDRMAYELGLLQVDGPFEYARQNARINELAHAYRDHPDFSQRIRRR